MARRLTSLVLFLVFLLATVFADGPGPSSGSNSTSGSGKHESASDSGNVRFRTDRNHTNEDGDERFHYRNNILKYDASHNLVSFSSRSVSTTGNTRSVDAIRGAAFFPYGGFKFAPGVFLLYRSKDSTIDDDNSETDTSVDVSTAESYVAKTFQRLEERTSNGTVVNTVRLALRTWVYRAQPQTDPNLRTASFVSTNNGFTVALTFTVSNIVGILTGNVTITPRTIESFIDVLNYTYADPTNHLALVVLVGQASSTASVTYNVSYVPGTNGSAIKGGSGLGEAFVYFHGSCQANTTDAPVRISHNRSTTAADFDNNFIKSHFDSFKNLVKTFETVVVEFPVGATSVTYDPSAAFGAPDSPAAKAPADSASSILIPSILLSFVAFLLAFMRL